MYTLGRHVLESKSQGAFVIPAVFLHQELPIRMSHALSMLNNSTLSLSLPINMAEIPTFQRIARSYLEDISLMTQMPKPSTPKLEEQFTALLCDLERRHTLKMLTIDQGLKELDAALKAHRAHKDGAVDMANLTCPKDAAAIQSFFNRFYTINLGTRLLIGEHLSLKYSNENLVKRLSPLKISQSAIRAAQVACAAHYRPQFPNHPTASMVPMVEIQASCPNSSSEISATYVEEFLHGNISELLKNAMRATCESHLPKLEGDPVTIALGPTGGPRDVPTAETATGSTAKRPILPPIKLTLVHGGEDVSFKITDEGGGFPLSDLDRIWSYTHSSSSFPSPLTSIDPMTLTSPTTSTDTLAPANVSMGHGLPLARLIARYFGGDLNVVPLEGHGTDSYLSLYRNDDHLENFPELETEMLDEVDVFVEELLDDLYRCPSPLSTTTISTTVVKEEKTLSLTSPSTPQLVISPQMTAVGTSPSPVAPRMPVGMVLGLGKKLVPTALPTATSVEITMTPFLHLPPAVSAVVIPP
ncbi:hypothetical protein BGZ83_000809 [Gryganskiella cystojenkinii]|nr:hypothetical protein BGZ83_000809 [Gryganskiella cystojenkinii]